MVKAIENFFLPLLKHKGIITSDNKINKSSQYITKLAGVDQAKSMGFTHTNPAKTTFDEEEQIISKKPKSVIKETK